MNTRWLALALLIGAAHAQDGGPRDDGLLDLGPAPATPADPDLDPADPPLPSPLGAIFDQAARAAARDRNRLGLDHTRHHRYPEALAAFREAHALDPTDPEITNNLGYLHHLLGNRIDAERYLRETLRLHPHRAAASDNHAELLAEDRAAPPRLAEAADLLARLRLLRGNDPAIIRRQAHLATRRGQFDAARRFYDARLARAPADDALALELGDFYRALGEPDRALDWYRRVRSPDGDLTEAARRIRELEIEREARRFGWVQPTGEPPPQARTLLERARAALGARRPDDAARLLEEATTLAPDFADAWHALGDAHAARGDDTPAEIAWLRALVIDAAHADAARRLGELYRRRERWPDAALMLTRALTLRPDRTELHLEIARAWQSAGDLPRALRRVRLGLAALPEDAPDDALRALERRLTAPSPAPAPTSSAATPTPPWPPSAPCPWTTEAPECTPSKPKSSSPLAALTTPPKPLNAPSPSNPTPASPPASAPSASNKATTPKAAPCSKPPPPPATPTPASPSSASTPAPTPTPRCSPTSPASRPSGPPAPPSPWPSASPR